MTPAERARGFVRPVRRSYQHAIGCGACGHCHNWATTYTILPIGDVK